MLADLILKDLPIEALVALKHAINDELRLRKRDQFVAHRLERLNNISFYDVPSTSTYDEAVASWLARNSSQLFSLPGATLRNGCQGRMKYLPCLLAQDWSHLFPTISPQDASFYVYAHLDPRESSIELPGLNIVLKGTPFYIGKGCGNRAWDLKRNQGHAKAIKNVRGAGFPDESIVQIVSTNLSEQAALILEAKLIYLFGSIYDESIYGCLVNLADHVKPIFLETMVKLPPRKAFNKRRFVHIDMELEASLSAEACE